MTTPATEDDMSELVDATFPRVDLVGKAANGVPRFLVVKADESAGLLNPDYVRDLISKSEPSESEPAVAPAPPGVTVSGSAAEVAAFIHKAAQRASDAPAPADPVAKAKYSADDKRKMLAAGHAIKNDNGDPSYPIGDKDDLSNAIGAVGRGGADHDRIRAYVIRRAKDLGASSEIPDNWNSDGSLKDKVSKDMGPVLDDAPDQMDAMDVTVPLAEPDMDAPGDPADPGSPAWEAIDAATACKWTSILSRARVAIDLLAEREMLEAASADPDDIENAWDLQDVCCAIDYAISVLAPFAVAEQSEADCGTDALEGISKAMAGFDSVPMDQIEALARVAKAGRVLSSANEGLIRDAAGKLQSVLASLPSAPQADDSGQPVAKQKETPVTATATEPVIKEGERTPEQQAADRGPVSAAGTTGLGQPRETGPAEGPQAALPGDVPGRQVIKGSIAAVFDQHGCLVGVADPAVIVQRIEKADGEKPPMQAVFDQNGELIGIVDPAAIQPVTGAGKVKPDDGKDGAAGDADMTPQPPGDAGTPADVAKSGTEPAADEGGTEAQPGSVAKSEPAATETEPSGTPAIDMGDVLKSIAGSLEAVTAALGSRSTAEGVAKQADVAELTQQVDVLKAQVERIGNEPAYPKVALNGATPPSHMMRGQDRPGEAPQVDVAKAAERRRAFYAADPAEQNRLAGEMQSEAISALAARHRG